MASMYSKLCNKQHDFFYFRMSYLHNEQGSTNDFKKKILIICSYQIMLVLWQHFHLLSCFAMSIIIIKKFMSCEDILKSYNKKSLIFIL
jgi:hypothetical protein